VILLRSHIVGFGKLKDRSLNFQNGLNLVFAANEGGKSTLQRFLMALLYGQLRSDLKVQRRLDPWVEQYKPWHGNEYGGILWCRLTDGREVEIHRSFGKEETRIEIRTSSGEDITRQYEQQRNGEVLFARFHFGMPKELFESVGVIRENRAAEIHGYETIRDRIANLAQSGDEELSIRQSLERIHEKLDFIGSDRAPTKPYKQALDLVHNLREEQKALEERRIQFQKWVEERNWVAGQIAKLEQELLRTQGGLLRARRHELAARIDSLEEVQSELNNLRSAIESLGGRADFPAERLGELDQLLGARDSLAKHLSEIRAEKETVLVQLSSADSQRQELAAYAPLATGNGAEKITEWFVNYLSISLQKDGLQKTRRRLGEEAGVIEKRLSELSSIFSNPGDDWERVARETAEDEQIAAEKSAAVLGRIAVEKSSLATQNRTTLRRSILARVLLVLSVGIPVTRYFTGFNHFAPWLDIGLAAACVGVAVLLFLAASRSAKAARSVKAMLTSLDAELTTIREEGGKKRKSFNEAMKNSGFQKVDDFLAAARRSDQDRQKLAELQSRLAETEHQGERLQEQSEELYQRLKEELGKAGLSCSPGSLKFQIDLLRANLRKFRELDAGYAACVGKADSLKSREMELAEEHSLKCSRIQSLLEEAQVGNPEAFREECSKRQRLLELLEKESSRAREFSRLAENLTLSQWKDQLQQLMELKEPEISEEPVRVSGQDEPEPYLPYIPTIPELEEQEKRQGAQLAAAREEHAGAVERVKQGFQNFRPAYEIEEDLAIAERNAGEMEKNRLALEIALETIEKLSRQQQEVLAPQLNAAVEQRFLRLCEGRYEEVKIDPDFQVWVREIDSGELRLAEHLSRGTQDQLYFSLRFGIMDLVSNSEEPCPGFLDEPFAAYDHARLGKAFEVLAKEAEKRQILLFTCRDDLLDLGSMHGANVLQL
jgi:DNA repair exonuclease SbcCD ATPase subunit